MPLLLTITIWLPMAMPYSALKELVMMRNSRMPSTPWVELLIEAEVPPAKLTRLAPSSR